MNKDSDRVVYPMYFSILCSLRLFAVDFFAFIADRTASQDLWESRGVIGHVTI